MQLTNNNSSHLITNYCIMKVCVVYVIGYISVLVAASTVREATLDEQGKFKLSWSFEGLEKDNYITFNITAETTGWVGLGFSPNGGMSGADIMVAWVDSNGQGFIQDMYSEVSAYNGLPVEDETSNVELVSASEANGKTMISFRRKLNTCDKEKDRPITRDTTRVIFAWGIVDPNGNTYTGADYHSPTRRGTKSIYLLENVSYESALPDNVITFDMKIDNYEIPGDRDTTCYCSFHAAPQLDRKHHVVAWETIVAPGNEGVVHHLLMYGCWYLSAEHVRSTGTTGGICNTPNMPEFAKFCKALTYGWAVGGSKFHLPPYAGVPIGEAGSPEYYMIEMHYDNPNKESGRRDSSGVRLTYTPTLRQYDMGMTGIGYLEGIFVPPQTESFKSVGYCHESCTEKWIPKSGVKLTAYLLHSHLLGAAIKVDWYRNGSHIGVLASDNSYDFNYQELRFFDQEQTLLPGDSLKISCTMNSVTRTSTTFGGQATNDEMCLAHFAYYPKQQISYCASYPAYLYNPDNTLYKTLDLTPNVYWGYVDYKAALSKVSFTPELTAKLQQVVYNTSHASVCADQDGYDLMEPDEFSAEKFINKEVANEDVCNGQNTQATQSTQSGQSTRVTTVGAGNPNSASILLLSVNINLSLVLAVVFFY